MYSGLDAVHDYLGWIKPRYELEKPRPPPGKRPGEKPKEGGFSRVYTDPRMRSGALAYANAARDTDRLVVLPRYKMKLLGDPDGYEKDGIVYLAEELVGTRKGAKVLGHENLTRLLRMKTGKGHYELHPVVRPLEEPLTEAYEAGTSSANDFAERVMRALRN